MKRILDRFSEYLSPDYVPGNVSEIGRGEYVIILGSVIFAAGMPWSHVFGYVGAATALLGALINPASFRFKSGSRILLVSFALFLVWGLILSFSVAIRPSNGIQTVFVYFSHWTLPFAAGLWLPSRYKVPIIYLWIISIFILGFVSLLVFLGIFHAPDLSREGMLFGLHNHIQLAALLSLALIMVYGLFLTPGRSVKNTILPGIVCVFLLLFFVLTGSRGWWAAAAVSLAGMTIHHIIINRERARALIVAIIGILFVLGSIAMFPQVRARISMTGFNDLNFIYRRNMAIMAREVIKDNPVTGIGPGQVPFAEKYFDRMGKMNLPQETGYLQKKHFHNMYLQAAAEFGLPGALVFLFILFQSFRILIVSPARLSGAYGSGIIYGVLWSFAALAIAELFDCLSRGPAVAMEYFWVLGICAGMDAGGKSVVRSG
jgi:O-antigen ligase